MQAYDVRIDSSAARICTVKIDASEARICDCLHRHALGIRLPADPQGRKRGIAHGRRAVPEDPPRVPGRT